MLSFLNSILLPALAAAAIPLIIHFFNRKKAKKIPFSSIRFLKLIENKRIRQVRIYQILLIIIRVLFIVFLVLAFSRPALREIFTINEDATRTTAVLFVDDSYSMQSYIGSLQASDKAREILKQILSTFNNEDHVSVISPSMDLPSAGQVKTQPGAKIKTTYSTPDFNPSLNFAREIFEDNPNLNKEFYFISDMRLNRFHLADTLFKSLGDESVRLNFINTNESLSTQNINIDTVYIKDKIIELKETVTLIASIRNHSPSEPAKLGLHLFRGNSRIAMREVELLPGDKKDIEINFLLSEPGHQLLRIELEDDDLMADNYYYLNFSIADNIEILYVENKPSVYMKNALQTLQENSFINIHFSDYDRWHGKQFENYDLIVLSDFNTLLSKTVERLASFINSGKNILLIPGKNLNIIDINKRFKPLLNKDIFIDFKQAASPDNYFAFNRSNANHPLFAPIFSSAIKSIGLPKTARYFKIKPPDETLLAFENRDPLLGYFSAADRGKIYVLTTQMDLNWTDLPLRGFFIPMLQRIFYTAGQPVSKTRNYTIGQDYLSENVPYSLKKKYFIRRSGEEKISINPQQKGANFSFFIENIRQPGHFIIYEGNKILKVFSVNVSSKELLRPFYNFENMNYNIKFLSPQENLPDLISKARIGQELWLLFVLLSLAMLLTEMWLVKKIEGKMA